jgi:hypothetical protein
MLVTAAAWILLVLYRVCGSVVFSCLNTVLIAPIFKFLDEVQYTCSRLKHIHVQVVIEIYTLSIIFYYIGRLFLLLGSKILS